MGFDPGRHHRRSIRLKGYDYSQPGVYFVTICTQNRECLFGEVVDGVMRLGVYGQIVAETWQWLAAQYSSYITLDEWVVMPNHLHGIIVIRDSYDGIGDSNITGLYDGSRRGGSRTAPTGIHKPLGRIIGAFKTVSTKRINELRGTPGMVIWQRNYYEHIIRDEESLKRIRQYILDNPLHWYFDKENRKGFNII
ncbi:MAG: transposase [Firmicutes bacterium]|nr:transposase [Bacillota bacterium]